MIYRPGLDGGQRKILERSHSGKRLTSFCPATVGRRTVLADRRLRVQLQDVKPRPVSKIFAINDNCKFN